MSELKPCPFCGGKARLDIDLEWYYVYCTKCQAQVEGDWRAEAIKMWNRRVEDGKT